MRIKRCLIVLVCIFMLASSINVTALTSDEKSQSAFPGYTYDIWGEDVACPDPYSVVKRINGLIIGEDGFKNINDVFTDNSGLVYIAVSGNEETENRIIIFDAQLNYIKSASGYKQEDGTITAFQEPLGLFVTDIGDIYLADGKSKNIIQMDRDFHCIRLIGPPSGEAAKILKSDFHDRYRPAKLVVDATQRIHAISTNVNEGIVEFDQSGNFAGFLAAGKVHYSAAELFWRRFSTKAQLERMTSFVPTEYNNIDLDSEGFLFVTLANVDENKVRSEIESGKGTQEGALVRRLNLLGNDILKRNGNGPPVGDLKISDSTETAYTGVSQVVDVSCSSDGEYALLDSNRKHIFTYDSDGYLLYAFNGPDVSAGGLNFPVAIAQHGEYLYVADNGSKDLVVYRQTDFARYIHLAISAGRMDDIETAGEYWQKILDINPNYSMAYTELGKLAYQKKDYQTAMSLFQKSYNQSWYSKAFEQYRTNLIDQWFSKVAFLVVGVVGVAYLIKIIRFLCKRGRSKACHAVSEK